MKMIRSAAAVGLALGALGSAAGATALATTPTRAIYLHGGSRQALFPSKAACTPHAQSIAAFVAQHRSSGFSQQPMGYYNNRESAQDAVSCFPLASGKWTYFNVYSAPVGKKITSSDAFLEYPNANRNEYPGMPDDETYNMAIHQPSTRWSLAACKADYAKTMTTLRSNTGVAPTMTEPCAPVGDSQLRYTIFYAIPTGVKPLWGDNLNEIANQFPLVDEWRYDMTR